MMKFRSLAGRLRHHYFIGGRFQDAICLGILAEEYRGVALPRMNALIATARHGQEAPPR